MLALLLTLATLAPQEVLTETLPDGSVVEREVVRDADGNPVDHGSYKVRHANGEEAVRGRMKDGLRHGKWRFFHPNGKKQATGWYLTGLREREWTYWDEEGQVDETESGEYEIVELEFAKRRLRSRGEARAGQRHGAWTFFWEEGTLKASGTYARGQLDGEWRFHHPDGTFDPSWISGVYQGGRRVAQLPGAEEAPPPVEPAANDAVLAQLSALRTAADGDAVARETLALLNAADADHQLAADLLGQLDPTRAPEAALARRIREQVLVPAWGGLFEEQPRRRWTTLLRLAREDPGFRLLVAPGRLAELGEGAALERLHPAPNDASADDVLAAYREHLLAGRFAELFPERGRRERERAGPRTQALASALTWLRNHQSPDGSWDTDGFAGTCATREAAFCGGPGDAHNDAGMTGLALLALLGAGSTPHYGPHAEAVARGVGWLLSRQDPKTGLLGQKLGHPFIYNHAIGTMALCEAAGFSESEWLREGAQKAVDYCTRARNPGGAWRYDVPPSGDNDTSITAWMVQALRTAEAAGLDVDEGAFDGALGWIEKVTDPDSARCGYDSIGSKSARIEHVNEHYPPEMGEAMTAAALYCRFVIGQDPSEVPILERHAKLMALKPPIWDPDGYGCDMYYWYYGSHAMYQMGTQYWVPWQKAMNKAILGSQRQDGDTRGSWDPVGPWGYAGGRIYSTAMMALCLEVESRYPRVVELR